MTESLEAVDRIVAFLDAQSTMRGVDHDRLGEVHTVDDEHVLTRADLRVVAEYVLAWRRLAAEVREHAKWYNDSDRGGYRTMVDAATGWAIRGNAGITDDGHFYAGAWIDAEWFEEEYSDPVEADNPVDAIDNLIERMRKWRADRDAERAELMADNV